MKTIGVLGSVVLLIPTFSFSQDLIPTSVALSDNAYGILLNPAGLGVKRGSNGMLAYSSLEKFGEKRPWEFSLLQSFGGLGLGYRHWSKDQRRNMYSFVLAPQSHKSFHLGLRGRVMNLVPGNYFALDLGLLYRPTNFLSLGATFDNLNKPAIGIRSFEREYRAGIAFRPMTNRITLFADRLWTESEPIKDFFKDIENQYLLGGELEPIRGILIRGNINQKEEVKIGLTYQFPQSGLGYSASLNEDSDFLRHDFHITYSSEVYQSLYTLRNQIAEVKIEGAIEDVSSGFSLFGERTSSYRRIINQLEKAEEDYSIRGVLLYIRSFRTGFATIQELQKKIESLKEAGKPVVAYLEEGGGDRSLYLASSADRIVVPPSGHLTLLGPRAEILMLKGLMDKLGVEADMVRAGKYKSAVEPLTQKHLSEEVREEYQTVINELHHQLTSTIALGRKMEEEEIERMMEERGAWWPEDAKEKGLIDEVGYYEDAKSLIAELTGSSKGGEKVKTVHLLKRKYFQYDWKELPKISVLLASGTITSGKSRTNWLDGTRTLGSETLVEQIRRARGDPSIKAIVLRVDSPGGEVTASDLIWREVKKTKEAGKPIIVSMGDLAASGGYYISCSADKILANPGTITGSIGVFGGKFVLEKTYEKLGLYPEVIKRGKHADAFSSSRRFTEEERKIYQEHIDHSYSNFVEKVAEGRGLSYEEVDEVAQGRIWTGSQALERGLIDQLGTLEDAIQLAKEMAEIEGDIKVVYLTPRRPFFPMGMLNSLNPLQLRDW